MKTVAAKFVTDDYVRIVTLSITLPTNPSIIVKCSVLFMRRTLLAVLESSSFWSSLHASVCPWYCFWRYLSYALTDLLSTLLMLQDKGLKVRGQYCSMIKYVKSTVLGWSSGRWHTAPCSNRQLSDVA